MKLADLFKSKDYKDYNKEMEEARYVSISAHTNAQYQQAMNNISNLWPQTTTGGAVGIVGGYAGAISGGGYGVYPNTIYSGPATGYTMHFPNPSGETIMYLLVDAAGATHPIMIDKNHTSIIDALNHASGMRPTIVPSQYRSLPDPDFSIDEMAEAEKVIEELSH